MLNSTILIKVRQRLNKLSSLDYDNIEDWAIIEAFNKGQVEWCRRNLHGNNLFKEGDDESKRRVDDLQILIEEVNLTLTDRGLYYESEDFPADYLEYKRVTAYGKNDCCNERKMVVYLAEQDNVDALLRDEVKKPSFEWAETFATLSGNRVQIYTNDEFVITKSSFIYYRQPIRIEIAGVSNPYTGLVSAADVLCEFKDDIVELFIDSAASIIAGDIESFNQMQRTNQAVEQNN